MHALTEADVRAAIVNAEPPEIERLALPRDFIVIDWDFLDFFAWPDPDNARRGAIVLETGGALRGVIVTLSGPGRARSGMCNICHTMQPGNQVSLATARRAGAAGRRGDSVGTYLCTDLSCHENVRL